MCSGISGRAGVEGGEGGGGLRFFRGVEVFFAGLSTSSRSSQSRVTTSRCSMIFVFALPRESSALPCWVAEIWADRRFCGTVADAPITAADRMVRDLVVRTSMASAASTDASGLAALPNITICAASWLDGRKRK